MDEIEKRKLQKKNMCEHVLKMLKKDENYLEEQIDILDTEIALFKTLGIIIENEEQKVLALDLLLEIKKDMKNLLLTAENKSEEEDE